MNRLAHRRVVETTIQAMRAHLDQTFSLQDMADLAGMSQFHFCRTFHAVTGIPPRLFLGALRLSEATRLLLTTDQSVTDVCFSVGYSSFGTFVRRYTLLAGLSPGCMRRLAPQASALMEALATIVLPMTPLESEGEWDIRVDAPHSFDGLVFVGTFADAIPQGRPISYAVLMREGWTALGKPLSVGSWVFAAGFPRGEDPIRCLLEGDWVRGSSPHRRGAVVRLRHAETIDPPLVLAVPIVAVELLSSRVAAEHRRNATLHRRAAEGRSSTAALHS